jgi:hypothetical protein
MLEDKSESFGLLIFILGRKAIFHENPSGWNIIFSHIPNALLVL